MSHTDDLQTLVNSHDVVLFMKGTPQMPMCGFSAMATKILDDYGLTVHGVNVLGQERAYWEALKEFSDWPTLPQIYVKGEFIGGCDILREMHASGELKELLAEKKLIAA